MTDLRVVWSRRDIHLCLPPNVMTYESHPEFVQ